MIYKYLCFITISRVLLFPVNLGANVKVMVADKDSKKQTHTCKQFHRRKKRLTVLPSQYTTTSIFPYQATLAVGKCARGIHVFPLHHPARQIQGHSCWWPSEASSNRYGTAIEHAAPPGNQIEDPRAYPVDEIRAANHSGNE